MWNSNVNPKFAKCFILFMAIIILLQGCIYLGLSITGLIYRQQLNDTYNPNEQPLQTIFSLIYFPHEANIPLECKNESAKSTNLNVTVSDTHGLAQRTYILLQTYTVMSSLWIITSLFVLASLCTPITKIVYGISFMPWFICIIIGCIIDVISTGLYANDIFQTTNANQTFQYIGLSNKTCQNPDFKLFDSYSVIPAVIMTCITTRLILIWFLNIIGSSFCLSLSRVLAQRKISSAKNQETAASTVKSTTNGHATIAVAATQTMLDQSTQYDEQHQEQPVISVPINPMQQLNMVQPKLKYLQHVANISRQPSIKSSTQPSIKSSTQSFVNSIEETNSNQLNTNMLQQHMPHDISPNNVRYMANGGDNYHSTNTHNNNNNNNISNNYNGNPHHNSYCNCCKHINEELRNNNDRPNYYNQSNMYVNEELRNSINHHNHNIHTNMHISEQLRSHLPWSYTEMRPRSSIIQPHSHPDIPPPDYNRN